MAAGRHPLVPRGAVPGCQHRAGRAGVHRHHSGPSATHGASRARCIAQVFEPVRAAVKAGQCSRAILVGHNPSFDLGFVNAAVARTSIKRNPFHPFSTFDTATLAGLAYGQTVLSRAARAAGLEWDERDAHSAIYDAEMTAHLFCRIVNLWGAPRPAG